ncbi:MAG: hypothetical protein EPO40_31210 [Myxococcaceae bacterium]|nr:MAG: hypothetical protein EPO40_31210 [Myxococcaceae bacterium]
MELTAGRGSRSAKDGAGAGLAGVGEGGGGAGRTVGSMLSAIASETAVARALQSGASSMISLGGAIGWSLVRT